jgi:hypothetical protein
MGGPSDPIRWQCCALMLSVTVIDPEGAVAYRPGRPIKERVTMASL